MESTNFNFDADMDFSSFNMTSQQAYSKPDEGNTSAFFFGDEGIDTVGSFGQQYDSMNPALFSTNPQESSFGLQQQLSMDNTMANASAWTGQLTSEAQTSLNSFPPTPVQSFDSLCQPNYNTILGKRSLQLDVPEFPQPKRHETFSPFTPSTSSWQLDSQSTPSMASVEIGLSDEAADVCATWFNKYAMLPSDRHIESLSQLTGESSKAIRHWFGRLLKQGMGSHDSAYKSQTGFSQSEQLWADVTQQTSPDLSFNDFTATTLSENSCNHETTNNQPSPPLRGGKKGCTPTDDPELLRRDANKIYQCTRKCGKRYGRKCDWKRNEEEGYPSKSWMCSLCKTQGVEKVKPCFRKYHFSQHFRNIHPGVNCEEFEESSIVYSETDFPRKCGFCRHRFVSRQDRIDHIADHFKQGKCMLDWNDDDDDNNHDSDNADDDDSPSGGDGGDGSEPYDPPTGDDSQDGHNPKHMGGGSSGRSSGFDGQPPQNGFFQFQLSQLKSNAPGGQCSDEKQRIEPGAGRNADPGTEQQVETCAKQIIRAGADWHILQSPTRPGADPQSEISQAEDAGEQGSIHGQSPSSQQLQSSQEISDQRSMHGRHDPTKANDQDLVARNAVSGALLARSESPGETVQSHSEVESLRTMTESLKQDITRTLWLKGWLDAAHSKLDASMPESSKLTASLASMKQNRHGKDSVEGIPKLQTTNDLGLELLGGMNTEGPIAVVDPSLNQEVSGLVDKLSQTIAAQISSSALLSQGDPIQTRPRPRSENDTDMKNASGATSANTSQGNEKNSRASPDKQPDGLDQSSFLSLRLLGAGGFGTVDEVIHRQTNLRMARKTLKNREPSALQELKKEVDMLQKLRHPHVIRLLGSYTKDNKMSLLITPVADTTLALWLDKFVFQKPANLSEVIVKMFGCLVSSVRYLHEQRPVVKHMDIKPQNILVMHGDQEFPHVVLCDFGVSSSEEILYDTSPRPLTRHYIAPEVLEGQKRELSSDIWSLGCVLFEMASVPFSQDNPNWQRLRKEYSVHTGKYYWQDVTGLQHKLSGILSQAKSQSESTVVQTVQSMLHASPAERPSATALTLLFTPAPCCLNWPNDNVAFPGPKEEARTVEMLLNNNGVNPREQFHQKCRPKVAHSKPSKVSGLSSSKKDRVVGFLKDPVISVWRPVNTVESWATYDFEMHARKSPYCENRHEVHRFHDPLCDVGHRLAPAPEGFNQVQTWLSECSHFHEACQRTMNNDRALPTRLIDIQPEGGNGQFVRVVDSTQIDTSSGQVDYVAVSHTWHESDLTLSSDRLQMMKKELLRETLPRSIVEAMQAAQRIGYRYLWVDSLCILQDCEADKREECMKMASVFRNAIMTIVPHALDESSAPASHLPTGEAGNMGASTKPFADARLETCVRPATGSTTTLPPILPTIDFTSLGFAWDTRAWTFQERLLSRRYLHISNEQVYWECNSLKASETFPNGLESSLLWEKAHTKVSSTTPQPQAQQVNSAMSSQMSLATDELKKIHPSVRPFMSYTYDRAVDSEPSSSMIAHTQPFTRPTAHRLRDCQWIKKEGDGIGDSMQAAQMMLKLSSLSQKRSSSSPSANLLLSSSTMPLALSTPSTEPSSEPPRKRAKLDSANIPRRTSVATFNTISSRTKLRELWTQFTAVVEQRSRRTSTSSLTNIEPTRDNHNPSTSTGKDLGTSSLAAAVPSPARLSLSPHTDAVRGISSFNHNHPFEFRHAHRNDMDRNDMERDDLEVKVTAMMRDDAAPTVPVAAHFGFAQTEPSPLSRSNPKNKPTPSRKPTSTTNIANQTPLI